MSEPRSIGSLVDALGVQVTTDEGDLVSGAVVILKVVNADGDVVHRAGWSDGMSWIERRGMIEVARDVERCNERGGNLL